MNETFMQMATRILEAELLASEIDIEQFFNKRLDNNALVGITELKSMLDNYIKASDRLRSYKEILNNKPNDRQNETKLQ